MLSRVLLALSTSAAGGALACAAIVGIEEKRPFSDASFDGGASPADASSAHPKGGPRFPLGASLGIGSASLCVLYPDGRVCCVGNNEYGQLGSPTSQSSSLKLLPVSGNLVFSKLSVGFYNACGLTAFGEPYCWGILGRHPDAGNSSPTLDVRLGNLVDVGATNTSRFGLRRDKTVVQVGEDAFGIVYSVQRIANADELFVGSNDWACATVDRALWCFGAAGSSGVLGNGSTASDSGPYLTSSSPHTKVSLGIDHGCEIRTDSSLWCWGSNREGQLALTGAGPFTPTRIMGDVVDVVAAESNTCAIVSGGVVQCWGEYLGADGSFSSTIKGATTILNLGLDNERFLPTSGGGSVCVQKSDGSVWCWGYLPTVAGHPEPPVPFDATCPR